MKKYGQEIFTSNDITYICYITDRRDGFTHNCKIMHKGRIINTVKCYYYNRTWESYRFESVLKKAENFVDNNLKLEKFKKVY